MGGDQGRSPVHQAVDGFLDDLLGLGFDRACRFVEKEDAAVGEEGTGDGDALALPAGESDSALPDFGPGSRRANR